MADTVSVLEICPSFCGFAIQFSYFKEQFQFVLLCSCCANRQNGL